MSELVSWLSKKKLVKKHQLCNVHEVLQLIQHTKAECAMTVEVVTASELF